MTGSSCEHALHSLTMRTQAELATCKQIFENCLNNAATLELASNKELAIKHGFMLKSAHKS